MITKIVFLGLLFLLLLCVATTFVKHKELMIHHEIHVIAKESIGNIAVDSMKSVDPEPLEHETMFINTLKDCMPSTEKDAKECKTFVPKGSKERIAVLTPPGKMDASLLKFIRIVLMKGKKGDDGESASTQVEVIHTTHMAPYGYGKTHGYTRIVRTVPQPLLLGATDMLNAALKSLPSLSLNDITLNDLKAALRQQIRYNCRLNHIAAHTAMWTIGVEDFAEVERPLLVEAARTFLGLDVEQEDLFHKVNAEYEGLDQDVGEDPNDEGDEDDESPLAELNHLYAEGSRIMSRLQMEANANKKVAKTKNILRILDEVLLDEMRLSKNLTAWPCESFWTVGEKGKRLELSPIIRKISEAMSPNCNAPYTSCVVNKDECEARGDGRCK